MTVRDRFLSVLNGKMPVDRLPMTEWAAWWTDTVRNWEKEGLPGDMAFGQSQEYFGLDEMHLIYIVPGIPNPAGPGLSAVRDLAEYESFSLFTDEHIENALNHAMALKSRHEAGEIIVRVWLDGFFFFPRRLFGIERHLFAFYDEPELMLRMNEDLCRFNMRAADALTDVIKPDFFGIVEDMSYNNGAMLSYEQFKTFILPFYKRLTTCIKSKGIKVLADSDGDVTDMIPWFIEGGIDGVYPLERQAGVDIAHLRRLYPDFILLGGYDKMAMLRDESAMRAEFERILPVMRSGYFIPSVDHQTPPGVSLENYRTYIRLLEEYCKKAV